MRKYISEEKVERVPKNGTITIGEETLSISNLEDFFEANKSIANGLGYYDYIESEIPTYNEDTQYLSLTYALIDQIINATYVVNDYPQEHFNMIS